ncbi:MAG: rhomboid family intramembrane serine protease [Candidatus Brocadiia bacterium]
MAAACALAYLGCVLYEPQLDEVALLCLGAKDNRLVLEFGEWWRLVSSGFLHASILHLCVNVYALVALGLAVERLWGSARFLLLYVVALVGGSLASLAATPRPSVGASGAVFGLFGAVVVFSTAYRRLIPRRRRAALWVNLAAIAGVNVVLGVLVPFIDNAAHGGGFLAGAAAALVLRPSAARRSDGGWSDLAVRTATALALGAVVWSLATAAEHARSCQAILLARTKLRLVSLDSPPAVLLVPEGWEHRRPEEEGDPHTFVRPGLAAIRVQVSSRESVGELAAHAQELRAERVAAGAEHLLTRQVEVGDGLGWEVHFRERHEGVALRRRFVVFSCPPGRSASVLCESAARHYELLEVVFDRVIHSLQFLPGRPQLSQAAALWERFNENPADLEACVGLGAYYLNDGRPAAAEQVLLLALKQEGRAAPVHDQLAVLYARAAPPYRRPRLAIRHAQKALELEPGTARYLATLALAHEAAGDLDKAIAAAARAVQQAPDDARYRDLVDRLRDD